MKNKIEYYYRIENINLHEQNNIYNFLYNNKKYIFFNTTRNIKEIEQIYLLQSIDERYYKIILKDGLTMWMRDNYNPEYTKPECSATDSGVKNLMILQIKRA